MQMATRQCKPVSLKAHLGGVRWLLWLIAAAPLAHAADQPKARDERLKVELFAEAPDIVTPTGLANDKQGRVFVAESHTHFRPEDYDGPQTDRILIFEDSDGDGRADKRTIFHEGFTHVMDIEFHEDGSLYVATRSDIHRMLDSNEDGKADKITLIVELETKGTYPHNGISGLSWNFDGTLNFGLGENLGESYTLTGTDGTKWSGGGEGGSTYVVRPDGKGLRRVSTGWWNPYGTCVDAFGRVFGTDNDPGASPPCRLIQIVEGGDYGYEYRYGRSGLHPLICWNGEIPGTLPMISGTGEAPCHIVAYEAFAFPEEYVGNLFVPCWADHRVERYTITQSNSKGLVDAKRDILVEGPNDFRPVGIDVAPDGSVFISDWVSSSYSLHKQGRIWRIKSLDRAGGRRRKRGTTPEREIREALGIPEDSLFGRATTDEADALVATSAAIRRLAAHFVSAGNQPLSNSDQIAYDVLAARYKATVSDSAAVRAELTRRDSSLHLAKLDGIQDRGDDPLLFHAAVTALARSVSTTNSGLAHSEHGRMVLLAIRRNETVRSEVAKEYLDLFLTAPDPDTRFLAVKWVADDQLIDYRPDLVEMLDAKDLDYRLFRAIAAALDRLDGKKPNDYPSTELLLSKIRDDEAPVMIRRMCLRQISSDPSQLKTDDVKHVVEHPDAGLRLEAVRTLGVMNVPERAIALQMIAGDSRQSTSVRAAAIAGLAITADSHLDVLFEFAIEAEGDLQAQSLRGLVGAKLSAEQQEQLRGVAKSDPNCREAIARLLDKAPAERPSAENTAAWKQLLAGDGNAEVGERIFFGSKVGTCSKCHQIDGRGTMVGPDLSVISRRVKSEGDRGVDWLLETILQPSKHMAPQFTPWQIVLNNGKQLVGLPRRKGGNAEAYLGLDGKEFSVKKPDIDFRHEMPKSIMPDGLLLSLTKQELRDLFAFLRHAP